jgi:hypothetical protein
LTLLHFFIILPFIHFKDLPVQWKSLKKDFIPACCKSPSFIAIWPPQKLVCYFGENWKVQNTSEHLKLWFKKRNDFIIDFLYQLPNLNDLSYILCLYRTFSLSQLCLLRWLNGKVLRKLAYKFIILQTKKIQVFTQMCVVGVSILFTRSNSDLSIWNSLIRSQKIK